jgi:hypothetical protein
MDMSLTQTLGRTKEVRALRVLPTEKLELRSIKKVGLIVFGIQLIALFTWSAIEEAHAIQGADFLGFYQSWWLISHGVLNPSGWWQAQAIFIQWPLALLGVLFPFRITLLLVQDLAIVGAELVAFLWLCDIVERQSSFPRRRLAAIGLILIAANPWIYWTASWDYHSEPLGTLFGVLAARDLFRGRRIAWLWCFLTALCGMIPVTYLTGFGLSLLILRNRRKIGAALIVASGVWFGVMAKLGAGTQIGHNQTTSLNGQHTGIGANSLGLTDRPSVFVTNVAHHSLDLLANLAPTGIIGTVTTPVAGLAAVVMGENFSQGNPSSLIPSFQALPLYVVGPVGTVLALSWLSRRFGLRFAQGLAALLVLNTLGWGAVWIPKVKSEWLHVSLSQAAAINHIESIIPANAAVVASQGIVGDFANRKSITPFYVTPTTLPLSAPETWVVVSPNAGIETATITQSAELLLWLAQDPNAKLMYVKSDIWAFRVRVPADTYVNPGNDQGTYPAALFFSYGKAVRKGPISSWYLSGNNRIGGKILYGDYYLEPRGYRYTTRIKMQGHGPATLEVWNDTTFKLADRRKVMVNGTTWVTLHEAIPVSNPQLSVTVDSGAGPFKIDPVLPFAGNYLEAVVYSTSKAKLKVRTVSMHATGPAR